MYDEQIRTKRAKNEQSYRRTDLGDELHQVIKVGASLRQQNDIAVIDIFSKKESVAIIDALILFILIRSYSLYI